MENSTYRWPPKEATPIKTKKPVDLKKVRTTILIMI